MVETYELLYVGFEVEPVHCCSLSNERDTTCLLMIFLDSMILLQQAYFYKIISSFLDCYGGIAISFLKLALPMIFSFTSMVLKLKF